MNQVGRRIAVVGTTGSGKTTLARQLAQRLGYPCVELDALHWGPNWAEPPLDVFREQVARAVSGEAWIVDGNYGKVRDMVWGRADMIVWLDYALPVILWQLARRAVQRIVTREELWGSNRETWRGQFLSRDSLFLWALQTYPKHRREYPVLLSSPSYAHLKLVRLRSPRQAREWLRVIASDTSHGDTSS